MSGKGDTPRPHSVSDEERSNRYDYAFRKEDLELTYEEWLAKRRANTISSK